MSLGVFAPMFEWVQKLRIKACQASQILGVNLIRFAFVRIDEPQFASIGHQDLVAALLEQTAYPGRVGTGLYSYTERLLTSEAQPHSALREGGASWILPDMKAYSKDLRLKVLDALDRGMDRAGR
jgi:hypothetical protein